MAQVSKRMEQHVHPLHSFKRPEKCIKSDADVEKFKRSLAFELLSNFVVALATSVRGTSLKVDTGANMSTSVQDVCKLLDEAESIQKRVPPLKGSARFGNPAFRTWLDEWSQRIPALLRTMLNNFIKSRLRVSSLASSVQDESKPACVEPQAVFFTQESVDDVVTELAEYAVTAFGNPTRLDYGSGHELNFLVFLFCLSRLCFFSNEDLPGVVNIIFARYIQCVRKIQHSYSLEPAGSRGSWGLDDYHFLPFLFGAAQLCEQTNIQPDQITQEDILNQYADEYFYLDAVQWILKTKVGAPFGESSPLLNDISAVPTWSKIYSGLVKMYHAEVLSKRPIVQHLCFGSLLPPPFSLAEEMTQDQPV